MKSRFVACFFALFVSACAPKAEISAQALSETQPQVVENPFLDPALKDQGKTKILCETKALDLASGQTLQLTDAGIGPESMGQIGAQEEITANSPVFLASQGAKVSAAFLGGTNLYFSQWSLENHKEIYSERLKISEISSEALQFRGKYEKKFLPAPKWIAANPAGDYLLVADKKKYSLRELADPEQEILTLKISPKEFVNPRWSPRPVGKYHEIFFDLWRDGKLRQAAIYLNGKKNNKIAATVLLPAPQKKGAEQWGLRRFDEANYLWLETFAGTTHLRMMDIATKKLFELPLPEEFRQLKFAPTFAVYRRDKIGNLLVLADSKKVYGFYLRFGKLVAAPAFDLPAAQKEGSFPLIYSAAQDTQLFLQQSDDNFNQLYVHETGEKFRRLGYYDCGNADFSRRSE